MSIITDALKEFSKGFIKDLKQEQQDKGMTASGLSSQSLRSVIGKDSAQIYGSDYWKYQTGGRGPGGMPPVQSIENWIISKGIPVAGSVEGMAWAIAKKIEKNGTDVFEGKRDGVQFSEIVKKNLEILSKSVLKDTITTITQEFKK